ncbi:unnamed protein product [marine sediment metagenome]|uniref:Uncharacterized protein n=1 Tax=marine sediment metagenome TaxID=412755 RepID=X0WSF1_9ZZZZ
MSEVTTIQREMQEFVNVWTRAGKPITRDWYEAFMKYTCPNMETPNACAGICPMSEKNCTELIDPFS